MTIPRMWHGRITDIALAGNLAGAVLSSTVSLAAIETELTGERPSHGAVCAELEGVRVNQVFYRREPHLMQRYSALAFDNIRRAPLAFVTASVYRAVRVFVISGHQRSADGAAVCLERCGLRGRNARVDRLPGSC